MSARLTLGVPGLAAALRVAPESLRDSLPFLETLLSRADRWPVRGSHAGLSPALALPAPLADWPAGPMRRLGERADAPDAPWCCCADPVHLAAAGDHLRMAAGRSLALVEEDARELAAALARALEGSVYRLEPASPQRWYLVAATGGRCTDRAPEDLLGRDVFPFLPEDPQLRRILTECQMALHDHAINLRREARGLLPANSLWFWGGGELPPAAAAPVLPALWTDLPQWRGVWRHAGASVHAAPRDGAALLRDLAGDAWVVLDAFPADGAGLETLEAFERDWATALSVALRKGALRELRIVPGDAAEWVLRPRALLRFWRRRVVF